MEMEEQVTKIDVDMETLQKENGILKKRNVGYKEDVEPS